MVNQIKNTSEVKVYEQGGEEPAIGNDCGKLIVSSHWNRREMVVLKLPGKEAAITVCASDLKKAIDNCTNV